MGFTDGYKFLAIYSCPTSSPFSNSGDGPSSSHGQKAGSQQMDSPSSTAKMLPICRQVHSCEINDHLLIRGATVLGDKEGSLSIL
jgi:hypothetical protein